MLIFYKRLIFEEGSNIMLSDKSIKEASSGSEMTREDGQTKNCNVFLLY